MKPPAPEFSIELTAQQLLAPPFRLASVEIEDAWQVDSSLNAATEAINADRLLPPTSDEVEIDLTPEQIDLLLLTGSIER